MDGNSFTLLFVLFSKSDLDLGKRLNICSQFYEHDQQLIPEYVL